MSYTPNIRNKLDLSGAFNSAVDFHSIKDALAEGRPDISALGKNAIRNEAAERNAQRSAEAAMISTGLNTLSSVKSSQMIADAQVAAAKKAAAAQSQGSMMGGIGSIIGAGLSLFSDRETKENINRIDDALTVLRQLKPVSFNYIPEYSTSPERLHYGFIAQDYKEVMPDATYYDERTQKLCIDPVELIGLLVRSVQQLESRVQYLEATKALAEVK